MTTYRWVAISCALVLLVLAPAGWAHAQTPAALEAAAKASPELVSALSKEIGGTAAQSAGAAGALFGLAKSRLKPAEFGQVSSAVPGMAALLKAAPAVGAGGGANAALSQM